MAPPVVSVIMPVYNVERFVAEAIDSVLAQDFQDFELIIVDDGGSDRSVAICLAYHDPRIRIISQPNRGLAGARNSGIAAARGEFIALLDSDDRWHRSKLMLHIIHLRANPEIGVSYAGSRLIDIEGRPLKVAQRPKLLSIDAADILLRNPVGNGSAAVFRTSALATAMFPHPGERHRRCWFDESFRQSEDIELWLRLATRHNIVFEGIEGLLTDYRVMGGGLSAQIARQFETWQRAVDRCQHDAPNLIARYGRQARAFQLRYLARRAVQLCDGPFAVTLVRQAIAASPAILWREPIKTLTTVCAAIATRVLPPVLMQRLAARYTGSAVPA